MVIKTTDRELYSENTKVFALFRYISSRNQSTHLFNLSYKVADFRYCYGEMGGCVGWIEII